MGYYYNLHDQHTAHGCLHNLRHCAICDVAYCVLCGRQWGSTWYGPIWSTTTTNATGVNCSHGN